LISEHVLEEVFVKGGINSDMIVQERSRPCNVQLHAEVACSRARGGEIAQISLNRRKERAINMEN
jgi:hypothetical protein